MEQEKEKPAAEKKDLPIAMIFKRPPHGFSVTLKTPKGVETYDFNSKEAMCVFLGARSL
jgi:hypothetical protein